MPDEVIMPPVEIDEDGEEAEIVVPMAVTEDKQEPQVAIEV